jgi:hypothetical protein
VLLSGCVFTEAINSDEFSNSEALDNEIEPIVDEVDSFNYIVTVSYKRNGEGETIVGKLPISNSLVEMIPQSVAQLYEDWGCTEVSVVEFSRLAKPYAPTHEENELYPNFVQAKDCSVLVRMTEEEYQRWTSSGGVPEDVWAFASLEQGYTAREAAAQFSTEN